MKSNIKDVMKEYMQWNLSWNIESMLYINKTGILIEDLIDEEKYIEALVVIVCAGIKNKDIHKAKAYVSKFFKMFGDLDTLKILIINDLKNRHKFLSEDKEDEEPINTLLVGKEKEQEDENNDRDKKLRDIRESYKYIIFTYMQAGYSLEDTYKKDLNNFELINEFVIRQKEDALNNLMVLAHRTGMLSGVAMVNMKKYPDRPESIRLRPLSKEERIEKLKANAEKFRIDAVNELNNQ